jgi:hypothetical protein
VGVVGLAFAADWLMRQSAEAGRPGARVEVVAPAAPPHAERVGH